VANITRMDPEVSSEVHSKTRWWRWWIALVFGINYKGRSYTLPIILLLGCFGCIIDLDHLFIKEFNMVRPLHLQAFCVLWMLYFAHGSYHTGWIHKIMLRGKNDKIVR